MADNLENDSDSDPGDDGGSKSPSKADPNDFGAIESAVNEAAKRLNAVWVTFILLMAYIFIATGKITHKDLFLETPVKLPVLGVDVPLLGYFVAAPVFVLAVHFYFLSQSRGLGTKFGEYEVVLSKMLEANGSDVERLRYRIDNSLFAQVLGGSDGAHWLLRWVAVLTSGVVPLLLLLFIQLTFLSYQDVTVTEIHRWVIFFDGILVAAFFPGSAVLWGTRQSRRADTKPGAPREWITRVLSALWRWRGRIVLSLTGFVFMLSAGFVSKFLAVLPFEHQYYPTATRALFEADADPVHQGPSSWFSNRLVLPDQNLIEGFDLNTVKVTRSLRGRNFVNANFARANLRRVDFTGADLSFASLSGANLEGVELGCAYFHAFMRNPGGCTRLRGAWFDNANMQGAQLDGADVVGASLIRVNFARASLFHARLQAASLEYAGLDAANLNGAQLDGASLSGASLTATLLPNASVRGADFTGARMFGAILNGAIAQDASFATAQLQGASLINANFNGAAFNNTAIYGADISGAVFKGALILDLLMWRRWNNGENSVYSDYYPYAYDSANDPFGKVGDIVRNSWYSEIEPDEPIEIPTAEEDRLRALFPKGLPPEPAGKEIKERLARLGPYTATADWTKLADNPIMEEQYFKNLGERLIIIACAKEGEGHVARGLMRSKRLCTYKDEVDAVIASGKMPDGRYCGDRQNFKQIWSEMYDKSCARMDAQP